MRPDTQLASLFGNANNIVAHPPQDFCRETQPAGVAMFVNATVIGRIALDPRGAGMLAGEWVGRLDRSLLIRSAREVAAKLAQAAATRVQV
jgi:hypothetical protein